MRMKLTVRGALRGLARAPVFVIVAVTTLALGAAVNAAVFGVLDTVVLRPLPYDEPDRLLSVTTTFDGASSTGLPLPDVLQLDDRIGALGEIAWIGRPSLSDAVVLSGTDRERIAGAWVSAAYFDVLGVNAMGGRLFASGDDVPGSAPVVVLSHGTWQRRYGGSADVIGRTLEVNEVARTIVGVLGPEFEPLIDGARPEVWLPYVPRPNQAETSDAHVLDVVARLAPGASFAIAAAQLEAWNDELSATNSTYVQRGIVVESLEQRWLGPVRTPLLFLLAGSLIVLAVACVNLGILFAARNASRQREVAVRRAIGADLRDLASPVITEVAIVALIGTFVGVVIAWFLSSAITAVVPAELPRFEGIRPSLRSLLFCATIAIAATLLVAAWPVARAMRLPAAAALRSRAAGETGGVWRSRVLIAMETAAVIVLLVGASLATRGFVSLMRMDPGFTPEGRISFDVTASVADVPAAERMQRMTGTFEAARQAVLNVPGVEAAGVVTNLPLTPASWGGDLRIDGRPDVNAAPALIDWEVAGPGYFAAAGIDVLDGRAFESQDRAGAPLVAIVNESLASRWFPAGAIGERISGEGDGTPWRTIVGVVSDVRQQSLRQDEARPQMYIADGQSFPWPERKLVVAVQGSNPLAAVAAIRAAVTAAAPELAIDRVDPLDALVTASAASARFQTTLLGIFAVIALVLGLAGVFGVVSDSVERRTHEIAIRKALGATDRRVLFGELVRGVTPVAAGVVAGATVALAGAQIAASRVHDLAPPDALTFAAIAVTLLLVSAGAIAIPATRASRRDPGGAMRGG